VLGTSMKGVWWLPQAPLRKLFGTLSCTNAGELKLEVGGELLANELGVGTHIIHGQLLDSKSVTLTGCFLTGRDGSLFGGLVIQSILASRGFFGAHLMTEGDFSFSAAHLSFSGLSGWAASLTGLSQGLDKLAISWEGPESIEGSIGYARFSLGVGVTFSAGIREKRLSEKVSLRLYFDPQISEAELQSRFVYPIQNLLSFATDHPNSLVELRVSRSDDRNQEIEVVGPRTFVEDSEVEVLPWNNLFKLEDVSDRVGDLFSRWLALTDRYSSAFAVYFGGQYRPPGYADFRFELAVQCLSLYFSECDTEVLPSLNDPFQSILQEVPEQAKASLKRILRSHPVVTAERALLALTQLHREEFEPLIREAEGDGAAKFISTTLNTLKYWFGRDPADASGAARGSELYWLTERLYFLLKISVLKELGFDSQKTQELLSRNQKYSYIRDRIQSKRL
jgi:hypothetical protein